MADPKATVISFLAALERLDIDGALALAADDIVYHNVSLPPARGKAAFEKQLRMLGKYCTGFEARTHHIAADGQVVLTERTDVLRMKGFEAEFWVCGTFEVRDGEIILWRDYFDWGNMIAAGAKGAGKALIGTVSRLVSR
ncbi:MAG TPA: limonene-1,2-epoxide hydrolase family protein [Amycolatopsis sp.]|nr:limonene-1,2-epoxide hydrolase family protein [Amycolatopsis sp.]